VSQAAATFWASYCGDRFLMVVRQTRLPLNCEQTTISLETSAKLQAS
jgi:hypothetical protein